MKKDKGAHICPSDRASGSRFVPPVQDAIAAGCSAVYFGLLAFVLCPPQSFWSGDAGLKLLQVEGIIQSGATSLALPYAGRQVDPGQRHFPIDRPYAVRRGANWYSTFPPFFSIATVPFYWILRLRGLYVLPFAAGVATVLLSRRLAANLGAGPVGQLGAAMLVAFASPLAFYSATYWEHAPAAALTTACFVLLTGPGNQETDDRTSRSRFLFAGVCLGWASVLRNEGVLLILGVMVCGLLTRQWPAQRRRTLTAFVAGAAFPLVLAGTLNWLWYGHPLGLIGEHFEQGSGGDDRSRGVIVLRLLLADRPGQGYKAALLPLFPVCFGAILGLLPGGRRAACGAGLDGFGMVLKQRFVALLSLSYVTATVLLAPNPGGAQFGPRYLLIAIPGLLVCTVAAAATMPVRKGWLVVIGVLGVYSAARGIEGSYRLWEVKAQVEGPMIGLLRQRRAEAVLVYSSQTRNPSLWHRHFASQAAAEFSATPILRLTDTGDDRALLKRLYESGVRSVLYLDLFDPPRVPISLLRPEEIRFERASLGGAADPRLHLRHYHFEVWRLSAR